MKYIVVVITTPMLLSGCTSVSFTSKDGTVVSYTRFMSDVVRIDGQVGDAKVSVGGSMVNVEALTSLLQAMPK